MFYVGHEIATYSIRSVRFNDAVVNKTLSMFFVTFLFPQPQEKFWHLGIWRMGTRTNWNERNITGFYKLIKFPTVPFHFGILTIFYVVKEFRKYFKTWHLWNAKSPFETWPQYTIWGVGWLRIRLGLICRSTASKTSRLASMYSIFTIYNVKLDQSYDHMLN